MASLCLLDENGAMARRWEIKEKPIAVGRGKSADVMIDDSTLSRRHFVVERDGENYFLKDLNSQNGTWVDGQRAETRQLHHHDCILAGREAFRPVLMGSVRSITILETGSLSVTGRCCARRPKRSTFLRCCCVTKAIW